MHQRPCYPTASTRRDVSKYLNDMVEPMVGTIGVSEDS
jgi:hypothetical protein